MLAAELPDGTVRYDEQVLAIEQDGAGVRVRTANGNLYEASHAIVAIPPPLAGKISYTPPLPSDRGRLIDGWPMGALMKVHAIYERPFWRDKDLSGIGQGDLQTIEFTADSTDDAGGRRAFSRRSSRAIEHSSWPSSRRTNASASSWGTS